MSKLAGHLRRFFSSSSSPRDDSRGADRKGTQHANGIDVASSPSTPQLTDIKYVDNIYDEASHVWSYVDTESDTLAEAVTPFGSAVGSGNWQNYCFVVVRKFPARMTLGESIAFKIVIKSTHLLQACKHVLGNISGVSWTSDPLEVCCNIHNVLHRSARLIHDTLA